jgi:2-dehydropantoate 2-reductase
MKIAIVGPGAMGCLFAAHLSKKEDVVLIDKNEQRVKFINQNGIKLEGVSGNWQAKVKATADPDEAKEAELIII